jgi:P-type Cu2+ transporter
MYSGWLHDGMERSLERYFRWISLVLSLATLAGPGRVFFAGALAVVRARTLHLDLPIALALGAAFARGSINTIVDRGPVYFDAVALLVFLLLIGRYLQQRGQRLTADASELLASLTPNAALVRQPDDSTRELPLSALLPGMIVVVRPGDTVPADGVVLEGDSSIDSALLTGESRPQRAMAGTPVFAGTINVAGTLIVRVDRAGEATRVAEILHRVEESANRRAPIVILANRMAGYFVAIVLLLALVTLGIWWSHDPAGAVDHAIALLIVTCPCALAMATPLAVTVAVGRAARRGILVRGGDVIEALATPGTLLLDKTGTLTHGKLTLIQWEGPEWVKPFVLALERDARHPVAAAFQAAWPDMTAPNAVDVCHVPGAGVVGSVAGRAVLVGSPAFAASRGVEGVRSPADAGTPVVVAIDGVATAFAGFADTLRGDSAASVQRLRAEGWCVRILSGDDRAVVERVARTVGVARDDAIGGASPEAKLHEVERLRIAAREPVVMVGDGVNDAAAIAAASAGIAVHGGAEASLASADVYLGRPGLTPLLELTEGARRTMRIIRRNIAFSLTYNALGVFLAMAGLINPLIAAILMPVSSITVLLASWYGRSFERAPAGARQ